MIVQPWSAFGRNPNVAWYSKKRVWSVYLGVLYFGYLLFTLFQLSSATALTLTNLLHAICTYFMFHLTKGSPFPHMASKDDKLTVWEQIDNEAHFTPTKKVYMMIPIVLFMISIFSSDSSFDFFLNVLALCICLVPKFPFLHKVRLFGINDD